MISFPRSLKSIFAVSLLGLALASAVSASSSASEDNWLVNGRFEDIKGKMPVGWKMSGAAAIKQMSGTWERLSCNFESKNETELSFHFWVLFGAIGTIWLDNVTLNEVLPDGTLGPDLPFGNPGFEQSSIGKEIPEWGSSNRDVTIFEDEKRASEGNQSIRFTHELESVPESRIYQAFPVEPGKSYRLSYDVFLADDFQGEAKGLVFNGAGNCVMDNISDCFASELMAVRDRCEQYAIRLSPASGSAAEVSQKLDAKPGLNMQASLEVNARAFKGEAQLILEDSETKEILAQSKVVASELGWQRVQLSWVGSKANLNVRLGATGDGELLADNVQLGPPAISPPLQEVTWLPAKENFVIPSKLTVSIQGKSGAPMKGGLALLQEDLKKFGSDLEVKDENGDLRIVIAENEGPAGKGGESYTLKVDPKGVTIKSSEEAGAFYGLMTLLQLLSKENGRSVVLACETTDFPDMPVRGMLYGDAEKAARWKMNNLMISTGYQPLEELQPILDKCASLNLKVIPLFMTLTKGYYVQGKNPNLAAGIWVKDEELTLNGTTPTRLANPYVIRTEMTDVELMSADRKTKFVKGRDYQIINGEMAAPYKSPNPAPFSVVRLEKSKIPDGATVLASYDHVSPYREKTGKSEANIPYSSVEPETRKIMGEYIQTAAKEFPGDYLNVTDCLMEFAPTDAQMETDSRNQKSGKTPLELMLDDLIFLNEEAKKANPKVRLMTWAGDLNDYTKKIGPKYPRDVMVSIWGYDVNWAETHGWESVEYWSELGQTTTVMAWYNLRNVRGIAHLVRKAREKGYPCLGMFGSAFAEAPNPTAGMEETARVSWNTPVPSEEKPTR